MPEDSEPVMAPAGWYPVCEQRWWSGTAWTDHRRPLANPTALAEAPVSLSSPNNHSNALLPARGTGDLRNRIPAQSLIEQIIRLRTAADLGLEADHSRPSFSDDTGSWYTGVVGERHVAGILSRLGPEWTVLHSVPVGTDGSDIDHVLIGPAGVYTLNTKHHRGKTAWVAGHGMMIGGQKVPYVRDSAFEARRAEKLLTKASGITVEAAGLIVLVGVTSLTMRSKPDGDDVVVGVVRDRDLLAALQSRRIYSDDQVRRIADAAVRPETWSSFPLPSVDPQALLAEFDELEAGADTANSGAKARKPSREAMRVPRARNRSAPTPRSKGRRRGKPSAIESLLQMGGLFLAAWIAYSLLGHH